MKDYFTRLKISNVEQLGSLFKTRLKNDKISYLVTVNGPELTEKKTFQGKFNADGFSYTGGLVIRSNETTVQAAMRPQKGKPILAYWQIFDDELPSKVVYDKDLKMNVDKGKRIWFGNVATFFTSTSGDEWNEAIVKPYMAGGTPRVNQGEVKPITVNITGCPHMNDGAITVAEYIVHEIKTNVKSKAADMMRYLMDYGDKRRKEWEALPWYGKGLQPYPTPDAVTALAIWTKKVYKGHEWDHKWQIKDNSTLKSVAVHRKLAPLIEVRKLRKMGKKATDSESFWHKYKKHDYFYDVWSNIHYGYVGLACGFDEKTLLWGASKAQSIDNSNSSNGDAPDDVISIKIGFALFKAHGLSAQTLTAEAVLSALEAANLDESRDTHLCIHPNKEELKNDTET